MLRRSCSHPHPRVTVLAEMKSENCAARPLPGGEVTTPAREQQAPLRPSDYSPVTQLSAK
jgi:hypothetical protein